MRAAPARPTSPCPTFPQPDPALPPRGFALGVEAPLNADVQRQQGESVTLFGTGEDGRCYAVTKHGRRRVVPGTCGLVDDPGDRLDLDPKG